MRSKWILWWGYWYFRAKNTIQMEWGVKNVYGDVHSIWLFTMLKEMKTKPQHFAWPSIKLIVAKTTKIVSANRTAIANNARPQAHKYTRTAKSSGQAGKEWDKHNAFESTLKRFLLWFFLLFFFLLCLHFSVSCFDCARL